MNGDQTALHNGTAIGLWSGAYIDRNDPGGAHLRGLPEREHVQGSPIDEHTPPHLGRREKNG